LVHNYKFWNQLAKSINSNFFSDNRKAINDVYPVHTFQAFLTIQHKGKEEELPVIVQNIDTKTISMKNLDFMNQKAEIDKFNNENGLIIDKEIIQLIDKPETIDTLDLSIQLNRHTLKKVTKIPLFATAKNINNQYVYINSKKLWEIISSMPKDSFVKYPNIEILAKDNEKETITYISNELKNRKENIIKLINKSIEQKKIEHATDTSKKENNEKTEKKVKAPKLTKSEDLTAEMGNQSYTNDIILTKNSYISIEDIFDKNISLINALERRRKAVLIIGIVCAGLIFIFIINNVIRSIDAKKKEIGFLMAGFASKEEISRIFLGNMLFCSLISFVLTNLFYYIFFSIYHNDFEFFHQPSWLYVLLGLTGVILFTILISLIFIHRISRIDPIKIIQNVSD